LAASVRLGARKAQRPARSSENRPHFGRFVDEGVGDGLLTEGDGLAVSLAVALALGDGVGVLSGSVVCCTGTSAGAWTCGIASTGGGVVRRRIG